ncbi:MAG: hypothetical protein WDA74_06720 [Spirochaetota bacterium]
MKLKTGILFSLITVLFYSGAAFAAIDQTYVERIIKDNRGYLEFLNICVSNFASEKKEELFTIYQKHFNGEVAFLQGEYKRAFDNIYDSQKDMELLYEYMLTAHYLEDSKDMLDGLAPEIIRSKNSLSRQYLSLGYRDRTVARNHYIVGDATHPKLRSYRIFQYSEGIKMAKRAKRYGLLALYSGQTPEVKRMIYNQLFKDENAEGLIFFNRFVDKDEKGYIDEMNKSYLEYEKEHEENLKALEAKEGELDSLDKSIVFEKKVERSMRFRREQQVAGYLLNGEFQKAEQIIRPYIDRYIYKLIMATVKTLSGKEDHAEDASAEKGSENYAKLVAHHMDNYSILIGESVLDGLVGSVKVVDDMKENEQGEKDEEVDGSESVEKSSD